MRIWHEKCDKISKFDQISEQTSLRDELYAGEKPLFTSMRLVIWSAIGNQEINSGFWDGPL